MVGSDCQARHCRRSGLPAEALAKEDLEVKIARLVDPIVPASAVKTERI
jgi:hypothetical protein